MMNFDFQRVTNNIPTQYSLLGLLLLIIIMGLSACGGSPTSSILDRSSSSRSNSSSPSGAWASGQFQPTENFVDFCQTPRTGIDPNANQPYTDTQGTTLDENNTLRSFTNEYYLWYNEVTDQDPALFSTTNAYYDVLKTNAITTTGTPKDQFHWSTNTNDYNRQFQSGESAGYGVTWTLLANSPPREAVVLYTQPNTPATAPGVNLARGARILSIDGVDFVNDSTNTGIDTLNEGLYPTNLGVTHTFVIQDLNATSTRTIEMATTTITDTPVNIVSTIPTATGNVGYIFFNSHIAPAEAGLVNAINQLNTQGVSDLVLDMRYNGGGYLYIASELSYMIGGSNTTNKIFENLTFNDKHPNTDPFNGTPLIPEPFQTRTQNGSDLPTLNLDRVFVLTGSNTCSASESVINSLRGADVEVIQIGGATCGKPYGAYIFPNCGTSYFTIQFKGANAKGYGDYTDGFFPGVANSSNPAELPGCEVADDYNHALGDENEARLFAALSYRDTGSCATNLPPQTENQKMSRPIHDGTIRQPRGLGDKILKRSTQF